MESKRKRPNKHFLKKEANAERHRQEEEKAQSIQRLLPEEAEVELKRYLEQIPSTNADVFDTIARGFDLDCKAVLCKITMLQDCFDRALDRSQYSETRKAALKTLTRVSEQPKIAPIFAIVSRELHYNKGGWVNHGRVLPQAKKKLQPAANTSGARQARQV